jgi:hypothetical protein
MQGGTRTLNIHVRTAGPGRSRSWSRCRSRLPVIHFPRLRDRRVTHFVPFAEFETDAAAGTLPDFSLIEPDMLTGHGDLYPAS